MEVGIFDVSVDDIFYHLWIITFQCRTLSQNRLSIHSIATLPVNVAKRSFYHNMQPGFVNYLCALPRCYRIRAWTEHAVVKAEEYTANNGGGVFQYIIISITCESFLFAVEFLVKTVGVAFFDREITSECCLFALPLCFRICAWTEDAIVKAAQSKQWRWEYSVDNIFYHLWIITLQCRILSQTVCVAIRSRNYQWMLLICLTALLSNLYLNRKRHTANNRGRNIRCFSRWYFRILSQNVCVPIRSNGQSAADLR